MKFHIVHARDVVVPPLGYIDLDIDLDIVSSLSRQINNRIANCYNYVVKVKNTRTQDKNVYKNV